MTNDYRSSDAEAVYDACATVPEGMVITYADLAQLVGRPPNHSRMVATILGGRPNADTSLDPLPWWRVVRSNGSLLDDDQIKGDRVNWVGWALDRLADEGVPLRGEGVFRRVDMRIARRMPIPEGIAPWVPTPATRPQYREPEPCWKHATVQYSCRDCVPGR
ncbi:MAG TPA: MGMT family protein [Marmoricola sp.]